jgi:MoxR-like ATPase
VFATPHPIEQEGTYPLPEAQLDRFMFMLDVRYPERDEEIEIVRSTTGEPKADPPRVLAPGRIVEMQQLVRRIPIPEHVVRHAVSLVRATRPDHADQELPRAASQRIQEYVAFGAGPRASQYLVLGAKARAAIAGRPWASVDDVRALAVPVLTHRVVTNFQAEAAGVKATDLVQTALENVRAE